MRTRLLRRRMEEQTITAFMAIGAVIFIGFFGSLVFSKYRIPDVVILITLGIVLGPDLLGGRLGLVTLTTLTEVQKFQDFFLSIALIIILFDGGLRLNIRSVMESMRLSILMSVTTITAEMLAVALAVHLILGVDFVLGMVLGTILAGTTGAVVIPIACRMRIRERTKAMVIIESVIADVVTIVIAISLLNMLTYGDAGVLTFLREVAVKFVIGGLAGFAAGVVWLFVLQWLHNQPLSYMLTVGALFMVAGVVELHPVESSGAVAALFFGLTIGNRQAVKRWLTLKTLKFPSNEHLQHFHTEIAFFVRTFFFVYLGLMFRFDDFEAFHLVMGLLIISLVVLARRITSTVAAKVGDLDEDDARAVFSLMPKGLSAAVLATLPAATLAGYAVWSQPRWLNMEAMFLNTVLIVVLGTTILATVFSYATEKRIDRRHRGRLRMQMMEEGSP